MENLSVPGAVSALKEAFSEILGEGCISIKEFETRALELARRSTAQAMSKALEKRDAQLVASKPKELSVHSKRPRTLATMTGDVAFVRTVMLDESGATVYLLDEELGLPLGDRVSPSMRDFLVTCAADVPFERTAQLAEIGGGSRVSATTVMRSLRRVGEAVKEIEQQQAKDLFADGVAPEAEAEADHVLVEADGTYISLGDGTKAEIKAMVAYAGKTESESGRVSRNDPVRLGCVGIASDEFWREALAQIGTKFDLAKIKRISLATDGEAQYTNGISALAFANTADSYIDPFHVGRAIARCAPQNTRLGWALIQLLQTFGATRCADAMRKLGEQGMLNRGWESVVSFLVNHASQIGGGPSMGTMEAEQQHTYKKRMASFPCARSRKGADAMARTRSWLASGKELPLRTREQSLSPKRRVAREKRLAHIVDPTPTRRIEFEGKGWEYPLTTSVQGMRADIRYRADLDLV